MKVLITQSNYIPWKGYFDAMNMADIVVLYDEMQYTKRDWRNRNKIKTQTGLQWITIPVQVKGKFDQKINETLVSGNEWRSKHWNSILHNYKKAPFFTKYADELQALYLSHDHQLLSDINRAFIEQTFKWLGIDTEIRWSREFEIKGNQTEKLLNICLDLGADLYISGQAGQNYMETQLFEAEGIDIHWLDYSGYPPYPQLHGDFEHGVSILDLILNTGDDASNYMKSF